MHCHDTPALFIGSIFKIFNPSTSIIYDAHELEAKKAGQSKLFSLITSFIEFCAMRTISGFITVSPAILKWYQDKFNFNRSITILNIPNFKKVERQTSLRNKFGIGDETYIFTHIGHLSKGRGIEELLEVFTSHPQHALIIFGFGDLEELIVEYSNKTKNIFFFGNALNKDLHGYLLQCDFGLCTIENVSKSDYFCLPNKFFEYMNAELTIIGSPLREISRVLEETNAGYIADNLDKFLKSDNLKKLNYICPKTYTWEFQELKLIQFYRKLIAIKV